MKTHFQYVSISLLLKMEAVGLVVLCTSSCVMNHVRNVWLCSFPASLVFMSMITIALLDSESTLNPLMLSCSSSCMNLLAGCEALLRLDAPFTAVWLLRCGRVSRDLSWKPISMHNHAPSNTAVVRLLNLNIFFYNSPESSSALSWIFVIFWRADGILMNSTEDILMWCLSFCNPDINCQAGAFEKRYNCYSLEARWGLILLLCTVNHPWSHICGLNSLHLRRMKMSPTTLGSTWEVFPSLCGSKQW